MSKPKTNDQILKNMINFCPTGALSWMFVIGALMDYAKRNMKMTPDEAEKLFNGFGDDNSWLKTELFNGFGDGNSWLKTAEWFDQELTKYYGSKKDTA